MNQAVLDGARGASLAVVCRDVTKSYGHGANATQALRGVNLEVRTGELLMLVGPSGCGKTTLISVIAGVLDRDGGTCTVFGDDLAALSDAERTRWRGRNIGFVFQAFNLLPTLPVVENVALPLFLCGTKRLEALHRADEVLERVGLADKRGVLPRELSGGQQQRVAIARALVHGPRLLVCDEPTSALDGHTGHAVMELFREVAVAAGRAVIVVTHDARIFDFADRMARMDDGHVVETRTL